MPAPLIRDRERNPANPPIPHVPSHVTSRRFGWNLLSRDALRFSTMSHGVSFEGLKEHHGEQWKYKGN